MMKLAHPAVCEDDIKEDKKPSGATNEKTNIKDATSEPVLRTINPQHISGGSTA
jgi:hypothetical protein